MARMSSKTKTKKKKEKIMSEFLQISWPHIHLRKIERLMPHVDCLVCLVSTVSGHHKNALNKGSTSSGNITKLEQSTFL
jgi:hypothetical protein